MGITAWWDVWCDADGCLLWTPGGSTRRAAAQEARKSGWKLVKGRGWRCPDHQAFGVRGG